jgi:hypothetical protein
LWLAATALLLEDAYRANHWDAQHLAVPILTASTCVAGVLAHKALARFKLISGAALVLLALLGSALCVLNTLGRTAADKDKAVAVAMASNRVLAERHAELGKARVEMARECKVRAVRCREWEQRVDVLQRETASMLAVSVDPKADAIARLAVLVGFDGEQAKAVVQAIEPAALPVFLELGAIILLGIAFPHRRPAIVKQPLTIAEQGSATVAQALTRAAALADLRTMREAGSGKMLADRWGVHPGTASRWLSEWKQSGAIERERDGRALKAIAGPAPRKKLFAVRVQ